MIAVCASLWLAFIGPTAGSTSQAYDRHAWFELQEASPAALSPLQRGATAVAFDRGMDARRWLLSSALVGEQRAEARGWLSYLAMREGRYREAAAHIRRASQGAPNPLADTLERLPDQKVERLKPSAVPYRIVQKKLFVPAKVKGRTVELIVDTDANFSFLSEGAAHRLGLRVRDSRAYTDGALGRASPLRVALGDVQLGGARIRNVLFTVLPDSASLFATLPVRMQGALGLPALKAMRRIGWSRDGRFFVATPPIRTASTAQLAFDGSDPIVKASIDDVGLIGVLDTGAETTNFWPPLLAKIPDLERRGVHAVKTVRGFGGDGSIPEILLPSVTLRVGPIPLTARPAHLLTAPTTPNSGWLDGRFGLDLLDQAADVQIDFQDLLIRLR